MNISWNGLGSFVVTAKPSQDEVTVVTNPFAVDGVRFPRSVAASIIAATHEGDDTSNRAAIVAEHEGSKPFIVEHAGEYEVRGMFVTGVDAPKKDKTPHTIYRFDAEGIRVGFLGAIDRTLTEKELEALGPIDVLIVPAGGKDVLSATGASEVIAQIEPRVVIPSYVSSEAGYGDASALKRELSGSSEEVAKFKFTKAALPEEEMKLVILTNG
ncbi:MAG: MBL fold metallo-hydrolase [Candidatus Uhrbacteria bacterium]|nr:MBL fold metallo-hydrolase [Candidatus Uhrbacteria bacterium]